MKKSRIAILAAAGLIILLMLLMMGFVRITLGKTLNSQQEVRATEWIPSDE